MNVAFNALAPIELSFGISCSVRMFISLLKIFYIFFQVTKPCIYFVSKRVSC